MSQKVEVEKKIDIQVDYVRCQDCGEEVGFTLDSDSYGDLQITAERCTCEDIEGGE